MSNLSDSVTDATLAAASTKWGMGGGAVTSIFGAISQNEVLVGVGVITTVLGFIFNWYFQWKRDKKATQKHELEMKILQAQLDSYESK